MAGFRFSCGKSAVEWNVLLYLYWLGVEFTPQFLSRETLYNILKMRNKTAISILKNQLKKMNYKKMPTIFQEALVLLAYDLRTKGQTVGNQYFDQGIVSQFNEYLSVLKQFNGDKDLAKSTLEKQFANTYWYYILYNSPVTNKSKIVNE